MKLRVLSPITHDGKTYTPAPAGGKDIVIEVDDALAQPLIDCNAAEEISTKKAKEE